MRLRALTRLQAAHREEKHQRLKHFIAQALSSRTPAGDSTARLTLRIIALSPESPIAAAVAEAASEAGATGIDIEAVFLRQADPATEPGAAANFSVCRYVSDLRLLDAHEQLVIGTEATWIGDCMRRDPWKRDAFERYVESCEETARQGLRAFEHVWRMGKALRRPAGSPKLSDHAVEEFVDPALLSNTDQLPGALVLRH